MKKTTLFVGDCDQTVAQTACQFDHNAVLINSDNYEKFLYAEDKFTAYTALADLPTDLSIFYKLLTIADCIKYCPPKIWSDNKTLDVDNPDSSIQGLTELFLHAVNKFKNNVSGLNLSNYIDCYSELADQRQTSDKQLWVVGCSTTYGVGVDATERYGHLLHRRLNLPVSFLAKISSSISWAADQILRSDICSNDIVVWGLTEVNRLTLWNEFENKSVHINAASKFDNNIFPADLVYGMLTHKTNFFIAIQKILEVVNFCNKLQIKLLIVNIHSSESLNLHLRTIKEFFPYTNQLGNFVDLGTDNQHPGPLQHQAYADFCHSALKKLQYI